ncbi:fluoride efflux transporter CrcB [Rhodobium gokarnense]|uniref:Fluoride-specific ion channel FluC n=1 Tax=Rhodobium gokarnense TaxID=364296 RepID=A0ABT3HIF1_9HYPH|nr:fluoride efflux transporter CrcB [Rhodobium gokarnense]MCW2310170.1 CrcB protein [Rhodobium gokarnense]
MKHILLVFLGGGTGAALRHLVNMASLKLAGPGFPFGTLTVNIVGSLLMGIFVELLALKFSANTDLRLLIATGFLGGFTTFSAFSLDAAVMMERGAMASAGFYVVLSVFASITGLFVGMMAIRIALG